MQILGKIGELHQLGIYLGHNPDDPYHISVLCDASGNAYTLARLATNSISSQEVVDFLTEQMEEVAKAVGKPIRLVGICTPAGQIPHIADFK